MVNHADSSPDPYNLYCGVQRHEVQKDNWSLEPWNKRNNEMKSITKPALRIGGFQMVPIRKCHSKNPLIRIKNPAKQTMNTPNPSGQLV